MARYVVDKETAQVEFDRWADSWDIDTDTDEMTEDDAMAFGVAAGSLVRAIRRGILTIDEDGTPTYTPRYANTEGSGASGDAEALEFKVPKGDAALAFDRHKDSQNVHKLNSYMARMIGKEAKFFARMDERDSKVCRAIALLFLGS